MITIHYSPHRNGEDHSTETVRDVLHSTLPRHFILVDSKEPVTVAARSKAWTVFAGSDAGIVVSNPTQGMYVWCVYAFILCLGSGLAKGWSLLQGVLPSVKNDYGIE
jgi:hypothetical protein